MKEEKNSPTAVFVTLSSMKISKSTRKKRSRISLKRKKIGIKIS